MDKLYELIDSRIKLVQDNTSLKVKPCIIKDIYDDGYVLVQPIGSEVSYKVLNYSGTDMRRGDNAQLFYTGNILGNNGYIGASMYRPNLGEIGLDSHTGNVAVRSGAAAHHFVEAEVNTQIIFNFNAVVYGSNSEAGTITFRSHMDSRSSSFSTIDTIHPGEYKTINYTDSMPILKGIHEMYVWAGGVGTVMSVECRVSGTGFHSPSTPQTPTVPFLTY